MSYTKNQHFILYYSALVSKSNLYFHLASSSLLRIIDDFKFSQFKSLFKSSLQSSYQPEKLHSLFFFFFFWPLSLLHPSIALFCWKTSTLTYNLHQILRMLKEWKGEKQTNQKITAKERLWREKRSYEVGRLKRKADKSSAWWASWWNRIVGSWMSDRNEDDSWTGH